MPKLWIFHPSPVMVRALDALMKEVAPDVAYENVIEPDLLDQAVDSGLTEELRKRVKEIISKIPQPPGGVVLCSCSTYGSVAEEMGAFTTNRVIRIDRPMAERAVAQGRRIGIAAALESTVGPTRELIEEVAGASGREVQIEVILCTDAWEKRQRGDVEAYIAEVVRSVEAASTGLDVIVLAQGSMAQASERLKHLGIPVLSSPRLAVEAVAAMCRA